MIEATKPILNVMTVALLLLGTMVRVADFTVENRSPDEYLYRNYARAMLKKEGEATKWLVNNYNSVPRRWRYPTPVRVGFTYLGSEIMRTIRSYSAEVLSYISFCASILSLFLLVLIGRRFFNPFITLVALVFMIFSPMDLAISRRAWPDALLGTISLLLVYFCCEIMCNRWRRLFYILFWFAGIYCLLVKESGIVIYGLCIIWVVIFFAYKEKDFKEAIFFSFGSLLSISAALYIFSHISGGFAPFLEAVRHNISGLATNKYALTYHTGPPHVLLQTFLALAPLATVLSLIGAGMTLLPQRLFSFTYEEGRPRERHRNVLLSIVFFMSAFVLLTLFRPYLKNLRYLSAIYALFYLMSGRGAWYILCAMRPKLKTVDFYITRAIFVLLICLGAWLDYCNFLHIFVEEKHPDLDSKSLRKYSLYTRS